MKAEDLGTVARRHTVRLLLQFGSTVTGHEHPHSDVDLGVLFERMPGSLMAEAEVSADLQPLYPGREIDLAVLNRADPLLLQQALARARLLFGSSRDLAELRMYAFKRYVDHRRFLDMERAYVRGRVGAGR